MKTKKKFINKLPFVLLVCSFPFSCFGWTDTVNIEKTIIKNKKYLKIYYAEGNSVSYYDSVFVWIGPSQNSNSSLKSGGTIGYNTECDCNDFNFSFGSFNYYRYGDTIYSNGHYYITAYNYTTMLIPYNWLVDKDEQLSIFFKRTANSYMSPKIYSTIKALPPIVSITDTNFKAALVARGVDANNDGEIEVSEAFAITHLNVSNYSIQSLTGISAFTNLKYLNCNTNQLDSLDVSKNTLLDSLDCSHNNLEFINAGSIFTVLQRLDYSHQRLETASDHLVWLNTSYNLLQTLNVSNNLNLSILIANSNPNLSMICINNSQLTKTSSWQKDDRASYNTSCMTVTGINNFQIEPETEKIVKVYNSKGQEIKLENALHGIFIYLYSNGKIKKVIKEE